MKSISMDSPIDGWAAGQTLPCAGNTTPVFMHYTGGAWRRVDVGFGADIGSVSMVSASDGWAAGALESWAKNAAGPVGSDSPLTLRYQNGAWTTVAQVPGLPAQGSGPQAMTALSPTDVWFAGQTAQVDTNATSVNLSMSHFDGRTFTSQTLSIANRFDVDIASISMVSPTEGWAVGDALWSRQYGVPSGSGHGFTPTITPLFLVCHGGVWSVAMD